MSIANNSEKLKKQAHLDLLLILVPGIFLKTWLYRPKNSAAS